MSNEQNTHFNVELIENKDSPLQHFKHWMEVMHPTAKVEPEEPVTVGQMVTQLMEDGYECNPELYKSIWDCPITSIGLKTDDARAWEPEVTIQFSAVAVPPDSEELKSFAARLLKDVIKGV